MTELTISNTIKIIIGILVVVVVVIGIYLLFKTSIIDFFKNLPFANSEATELFLSLINN